MIPSLNAAFIFLREHKKVTEETEALVMKRVRGRITQDELLTVFEKGISGEYGKVYSADAQTLMGWVEAHLKTKSSAKNYLQTGLLDPTNSHFELSNDDWMKEANKCFTAFLNGVNESNFHPIVYDRMMMDGKINANEYLKFFTESGNLENSIRDAKQKALKQIFTTYKSKGWNRVYFVG